MVKVTKTLCDICGKMMEEDPFDIRINGPVQKLKFKQGDTCKECMELFQLIPEVKGNPVELYGRLSEKYMPKDEDFEEKEITKREESYDKDTLGRSSELSPSSSDDEE